MLLRPPRSTRTDTLFPYTTLFRSLFETFRTGGGRSRDLPPHPQAERRAFRPHRARRGSAMTDTRGPLGWRLKLAYAGGQLVRSEERRVGTEGVSTCRSWWATSP